MDTIGAFEGCQTWNKKREMLNAEGTETAHRGHGDDGDLYGSAEDVCIQEVVAEFTLGIELFGECDEFGNFFIARSEFGWRQGEKLSPVGTRAEWG